MWPNVNGIHIINNTKRIEKEQIENEYSSWEKNLLHVDMFCFVFSLVVMISFACKWNGFRQSVKLSCYYIISMLFELM